jgi:hypothetical protein
VQIGAVPERARSREEAKVGGPFGDRHGLGRHGGEASRHVLLALVGHGAREHALGQECVGAGRQLDEQTPARCFEDAGAPGCRRVVPALDAFEQRPPPRVGLGLPLREVQQILGSVLGSGDQRLLEGGSILRQERDVEAELDLPARQLSESRRRRREPLASRIERKLVDLAVERHRDVHDDRLWTCALGTTTPHRQEARQKNGCD